MGPLFNKGGCHRTHRMPFWDLLGLRQAVGQVGPAPSPTPSPVPDARAAAQAKPEAQLPSEPPPPEVNEDATGRNVCLFMLILSYAFLCFTVVCTLICVEADFIFGAWGEGRLARTSWQVLKPLARKLPLRPSLVVLAGRGCGGRCDSWGACRMPSYKDIYGAPIDQTSSCSCLQWLLMHLLLPWCHSRGIEGCAWSRNCPPSGRRGYMGVQTTTGLGPCGPRPCCGPHSIESCEMLWYLYIFVIHYWRHRACCRYCGSPLAIQYHMLQFFLSICHYIFIFIYIYIVFSSLESCNNTQE